MFTFDQIEIKCVITDSKEFKVWLKDLQIWLCSGDHA